MKWIFRLLWILPLTFLVLVGCLALLHELPYIRLMNSPELDQWKRNLSPREGGIVTEIKIYAKGRMIDMAADEAKWRALPTAKKRRLIDTAGREMASIRERYGLERDQFTLTMWTEPSITSEPDETSLDVPPIKPDTDYRAIVWKTER
ncbi:MAG: hypothetical protein Q7T82_17355 [Armatimonadota bacterium]|nr:hypothetical protein [Armatimonadota bacterium]